MKTTECLVNYVLILTDKLEYHCEIANFYSEPDQTTRDWNRDSDMQRTVWLWLCVIDAKDIPEPVKALTWILALAEEPVILLKRHDVQNPSLRTETWSVLDEKKGRKGQQLVVLMGKPSYGWRDEGGSGRRAKATTSSVFSNSGWGGSRSGSPGIITPEETFRVLQVNICHCKTVSATLPNFLKQALYWWCL